MHKRSGLFYFRRITMTPLNILVVEDHPPTNAILGRLLKACGHLVTQALTAEAALASTAKGNRFDLAIMDIALPDGNGWGLFIRLRKIMPDLQGIALTGYGLEVNKQTSADAGFAAHLTKPTDFSALEREIARLFRTKPKTSAQPVACAVIPPVKSPRLLASARSSRD